MSCRAWLKSQSLERWICALERSGLVIRSASGMITSKNSIKTKTSTATACTAVDDFPVTSMCSAARYSPPGVPHNAPISTAGPNRGLRKARCAAALDPGAPAAPDGSKSGQSLPAVARRANPRLVGGSGPITAHAM
jgi:hypothetical protein